MNRVLLALALTIFALCAQAMEPMTFRDAAEEQRYRDLVGELRCVMCQNQSLADSNALIAHDLRLEVLKMMHEGKSDEEIKQFLVARYSEFVLYKPQVEPMTWALWFGPALLLLAGAGLIVMIVRKRSAQAPAAPTNDSEQEW